MSVRVLGTLRLFLHGEFFKSDASKGPPPKLPLGLHDRRRKQSHRDPLPAPTTSRMLTRRRRVRFSRNASHRHGICARLQPIDTQHLLRHRLDGNGQPSSTLILRLRTRETGRTRIVRRPRVDRPDKVPLRLRLRRVRQRLALSLQKKQRRNVAFERSAGFKSRHGHGIVFTPDKHVRLRRLRQKSLGPERNNGRDTKELQRPTRTRRQRQSDGAFRHRFVDIVEELQHDLFVSHGDV